MDPLHRAKVLPRTGEMESQPLELFEVESGQHFQSLGTLVGELQPNNPMVVLVPGPDDKAGGVRAVDESDGTVVLKKQVVGHLADRRPTGITVAAYCQQQLMLGGSEPRSAGLTLAPALEMP